MGDSYSNDEIADRIAEVADLLAAQGASPERVRLFREGERALRAAPQQLHDVRGREGPEALAATPGLPRGVARVVDEMLETGRWPLLDRLRGETGPEALFEMLPGVGERLAGAIHDALDIYTLDGLEAAAANGRIAEVRGVGPRRAAAIRAGIETTRARRRRLSPEGPEEPDVRLMLEVDAEFRDRAEAGSLRLIAPHRRNPAAEAWMPILHLDRDGWMFSAVFANSARAHALGMTRDWVILFYSPDAGPELQRVVVTAASGRLRGRRVVRGREQECAAWYAAQADD